MTNKAIIKPRWIASLGLWAGSDHYSFWDALLARDFLLPLDRIMRVYRIKFPAIAGVEPRSRFIVAYRSGRRECLVVLDALPAELFGHHSLELRPIEALKLYGRVVWSEPMALLSLLLIPLPILLIMILYFVWMTSVLRSPEVLALFINENCDASCVSNALKVHTIVATLFLMPLALVALPLGLMLFRVPRYRSALNYRFAQSYCAITLCVGVLLLAQLVLVDNFPFKKYGKFAMEGFRPHNQLFLKYKDQGARR